jgi:hypothetical protein
MKELILKHLFFQIIEYKLFLTYELNNLIKHECAHAIAPIHENHGNKFKKICKKLKCSKKWQSAIPEKISVYSSML